MHLSVGFAVAKREMAEIIGLLILCWKHLDKSRARHLRGLCHFPSFATHVHLQEP